MGYFERDLDLLMVRLRDGVDEEVERKLNSLKNRLVHLDEKNLVKINHSVMELVCAKHLILKGYDVDVEHLCSEGLTCDLYGVKGYGTLIVEVETGFVPPGNALNPLSYWEARITSKIARYSIHSNKFGLAAPPHHILQIPSIFLKSPSERSREDLMEIKGICDKYYKDPPLSLTELRCGRLHAIYIVNVDEGKVEELDPYIYLNNAALI